jgi:fatty-acid peroxygenase
VVKLLQDFGSVQFLDGESHRLRKAMFLSFLTPEASRPLGQILEKHWMASLPRWQAAGEVVLFDEVTAMLTRAACEWSGVPLDDEAAGRRTREFAAMVAGTGAVGPLLWRGLLLRSRCESWARDIIRRVRSGALAVPPKSPLAIIASHRDQDGALLSPKVAAVELINVLRPLVAVDRFIVFAAKALHEHPDWREKIASGDEESLALCAQEVRRLAPFFAFIGGRVKETFEWRGLAFPKGAWVLLDLYGTNRDARLWEQPDSFSPARLRGRNLATSFDFIPQGAGDPAETHRCPGEHATTELMRCALRMLTQRMTYDVPPQDLSVDLTHIPALPKSGFVMSNVKPARRGGKAKGRR